ncbi:MAG: hypothetical protein LCH46_16610 [Proteobacteria bacterium]|nr:hypothetical protein [Pseudomonadota bacterium]
MTLIIETILSVGKQLFGLKADLARARQERKEQVADYLSAIAQTIEDASASLRQNIYPHGKCQELLLHSQHMEAAIGDLVGVKEAADLGGQLHEVWEIERLFGELRSCERNALSDCFADCGSVERDVQTEGRWVRDKYEEGATRGIRGSVGGSRGDQAVRR